MAGVPRALLIELEAKYSYLPSDCFDIYVEGAFDRDVINLFLDHNGIRPLISVLEIAGIEVPDELLNALKLPHGSNKSRLIALAVLMEKWIPRPSNVACVVDVDHDGLFGRIRTDRHLRYTDFCSMEMYCLNRRALVKLFTLSLDIGEISVAKFLGIAERVLPVQFAARAVSESLLLNIAIPPVEKGLASSRDLDSFEKSRYVDAFITNGRKTSVAELVKRELNNTLVSMGNELRFKANGHDLIRLVFAFSKTEGGLSLNDAEIERLGGRILASTHDWDSVTSGKLFSDIHDAVRNRGRSWLAP